MIINRPPGETCRWHPGCFRRWQIRAKPLGGEEAATDVWLLIFSIRRRSSTLHAGDLKCQHGIANGRKSLSRLRFRDGSKYSVLVVGTGEATSWAGAGSCTKSLWHATSRLLFVCRHWEYQVCRWCLCRHLFSWCHFQTIGGGNILKYFGAHLVYSCITAHLQCTDYLWGMSK